MFLRACMRVFVRVRVWVWVCACVIVFFGVLCARVFFVYLCALVCASRCVQEYVCMWMGVCLLVYCIVLSVFLLYGFLLRCWVLVSVIF